MDINYSESEENKKKKVSVLLVDDYPLLCAGLTMILRSDSSLSVIDGADKVDDICALYLRHEPDVVIMDTLFIDVMSSIEALKNLLMCDPNANIVVLTQYENGSMISDFYKEGVKAFLSKYTKPESFIEAIHAVAEGKVYFLPEIATKLALINTQKDFNPIDKLTKNELAVLKLLALGCTVSEIAEQLKVSLKSASNYSQSLKEKIDMTRPADITRLAIRYGLISINDD